MSKEAREAWTKVRQKHNLEISFLTTLDKVIQDELPSAKHEGDMWVFSLDSGGLRKTHSVMIMPSFSYEPHLSGVEELMKVPSIIVQITAIETMAPLEKYFDLATYFSEADVVTNWKTRNGEYYWLGEPAKEEEVRRLVQTMQVYIHSFGSETLD